MNLWLWCVCVCITVCVCIRGCVCLRTFQLHSVPGSLWWINGLVTKMLIQQSQAEEVNSQEHSLISVIAFRTNRKCSMHLLMMVESIFYFFPFIKNVIINYKLWVPIVSWDSSNWHKLTTFHSPSQNHLTCITKCPDEDI